MPRKYANASKILKNLGINPETVAENFDMAQELLKLGEKETETKEAILYACAFLVESAETSRLILNDLFITPKK